VVKKGGESEMKLKYLKLLLKFLAPVIAFAFVGSWIAIVYCTDDLLKHPRTPDSNAGYVIPYQVKSAVVYATKKEVAHAKMAELGFKASWWFAFVTILPLGIYITRKEEVKDRISLQKDLLAEFKKKI
jgi:uncharacterized protein YneF (UPF0154 family)